MFSLFFIKNFFHKLHRYYNPKFIRIHLHKTPYSSIYNEIFSPTIVLAFLIHSNKKKT